MDMVKSMTKSTFHVFDRVTQTMAALHGQLVRHCGHPFMVRHCGTGPSTHGRHINRINPRYLDCCSAAERQLPKQQALCAHLAEKEIRRPPNHDGKPLERRYLPKAASLQEASRSVWERLGASGGVCLDTLQMSQNK